MASIKLWDTLTLDQWGDQVFRDSNGYFHIVGSSGYGASIDVYYAISTDNGATFTDGEGGGSGSYKTITTNINIPNDFSPPAIAVDSSDNIYIFWSDNTDDELYFRKKDGGSGGTWGSVISISDIVGQATYGFFRVEIDSDDNLIVASRAGYTFQLFTSVDNGSNWSYQSASSSYNFEDMCLGYDGHLWALFYGGTGTKYSYIRKITKTEGSPDTWSIGARTTIGSVSSASVNYKNGIICERDSETVWAFRSDNNGIYYIKYESGSWDTNWTTLANDSYQELAPLCTYDNQIYLFGMRRFSTVFYYFNYNGSSWSSAVSLGLTNPYTATIEHPRNLNQTASFIGLSFINISLDEAYFDMLALPVEIIDSDTITLSDNIVTNLSLEKIILSDTFSLSDFSIFPIYVGIPETVVLSDEIQASQPLFKEDTINLSDNIYVNTPQEQIILNDTINLSDNILDWRDIINDFRIVKEVIEDIPSDFRSVIEVISDDTPNIFSMTYAGDLKDIESDIRYVTEPTYDITNDFRMLKSWQVPGDAGFQSLGKEYIKVYINGSADDDVNINSVTIHKVLNNVHTANFIIGRPYDTVNKPTIEHEVEIRYYQKNWTDYCLLYKGYITEIIPGDEPDSLKVNCQDKYWLRNRELKYFYVGHKPSDNYELYYETISAGLSACGFSETNIGDFVPQTINLFGTGESDSISNLITNAGNYGWFYDVDSSKKLWIAGQGSIIDLERQELDKNIGLYQVLRHSFTESVVNIVNKLRVVMGDKVIRVFNTYGGSKEYSGVKYFSWVGHPTPVWDSIYEKLGNPDAEVETGTSDEDNPRYGVFFHPQGLNELYQDVYVKYKLPGLNFEWESWSDRFRPQITIDVPFGYSGKSSIPFRETLVGEYVSTTLTEGFTIDYLSGELIFNQRIYFYKEDAEGKISSIKAPIINVKIWKKEYYSETDNPSDDPQNPGDITSPLVFITDKIGDYPETIWDSLQFSGLGIQTGGWRIVSYDEDGEPIQELVPSWDDTNFAKDLANWNLSKTCDKKISGSIDLTIDAICHYGIDLTKRIMINEVLESSLNIKSMTYDLNNFTVSLELENNRYYKRAISIQPRGV